MGRSIFVYPAGGWKSVAASECRFTFVNSSCTSAFPPSILVIFTIPSPGARLRLAYSVSASLKGPPPVDPPPKPWKCLSELQQPVIFDRIAAGAEIRMITVLLATARIHAGCLTVSVGIGAEPGVDISRREADGVKPIDFLAVGDPFALGVEISPCAADAFAGNAGLGVAAVTKHGWTMSRGGPRFRKVSNG